MQPLSLLNELIVDSSQEVAFSDSRCLRKRLTKCDCLLCINSCSADAISLQDHQVLFDNELCSRCMRCVAICPNEAFLSPTNDLHGQIKTLLNQKYIIFTCPQKSSIHPDDKVIPCLGLLSIELLFTLGMAGPPTIAFNVAGCSSCRNKASCDAFLRSLKQIEKHASDFLSAQFVLLEEPNQEKPDNKGNRRHFISTLASNLASVTSSQLTLKSAESGKAATRTRRVPQKTELIKLLLELDENKGNDLLPPLCVHQLDVGSECTLCPLCTGICPTGALKIDRTNEVKQLMFNSRLCSGCGLCVSFCKQKAISLQYPPISEKSHAIYHLKECATV